MRRVPVVLWCWWLVVVAVVVTAGAGVAGPPRSDGGEGRRLRASSLRIERVELMQSPELMVRLHLSAAAVPLARTLESPPRIYVDVADATLGPEVERTLSGVADVRQVRTGQFDARTARVVIELAGVRPFRVERSDRTVTIVVGTEVAGTPEPVAQRERPTHTDPTTPGTPEARVKPPGRRAKPATDEGHTAELVGPPVPATPAAPPEVAVVGPPAPQEPTLTRERTPPPASIVRDVAPVPPLPIGPPVDLVVMYGRPFVWPELGASWYAVPAAEPWGTLLGRWRAGDGPARLDEWPERGPAAALYLVADALYLGAGARVVDDLDVVAAYERALRAAPDFPEAPRASFLLGQAFLQMGFAPEARAAFLAFERRYGASPLRADARLGHAAAMRLHGRFEAARDLIARVVREGRGAVVCRARLEQALLAAATDSASDAARQFRTLAASCPKELETPGALHTYARALVDLGERREAQELIAAPREPRQPEEEARLHLLAGDLAESPLEARDEYELARDRLGTLGSIEARARLTLLDREVSPAVTARALVHLARQRVPARLRARLLGEAAETLARAGRFEDALGLLERVATLGHAGQEEADRRRGLMLGRWIAALTSEDDDEGLATVYAAYTTLTESVVSPEDRLRLAEALGRLGLHRSAVRLLRSPAHAPGASPALGVALAEQALAAGDVATARAAARRVLARESDGALPEAARRIGARAALAAEDLDAAAEMARDGADPLVRAEVASALLARGDEGVPAAQALVAIAAAREDAPAAVLVVAGDAAAAAGDWETARGTYARALDATEGSERVRAAAGLARAARMGGDDAGIESALAAIRTSDDGLVQRAALAAELARDL